MNPHIEMTCVYQNTLFFNRHAWSTSIIGSIRPHLNRKTKEIIKNTNPRDLGNPGGRPRKMDHSAHPFGFNSAFPFNYLHQTAE